MRLAKSNPTNAHRRELVEPEAPLLTSGADARQRPAFRLQVRRSVLMHPVLAAVVAGISFALLLAFALVRKPVYTSESLIYVEPLEVRVLSDGSSSGYDPSRYDSYLQQQVQTVERADTLEAALAKLPPGMWGSPGENTAVAARQLEGALKVERVLNSYQLAIDVTAGDPNVAAETANAITSAYLEEGRKDEHARADQRLQLLTEERQRITEDMTRDKVEQASLGKSLGVANPNGASGNPYDVQSEGLRSLLASARQARDAVSAQIASISTGNGAGLDTAANELIGTDPELVSMRQTLAQRRAVLSDQMAGLTPANPVYKQDQEEIATIDRSVERATADARQRAARQLQDKLRLDLRRTADVEGRINGQLAEQTARATGAGPKLQRASELETDLQRLGTRYAAVDDAIRGLQLETGGPGQAHLVLAARVPRAPQPSRARLLLWLALPLALLFGVAAAVIAHKLDQRLYVAGDLQEVLGFAPMCVLPDPSEVSAAAYEDFVLRLAGGLEGAFRHGRARSFVFTPVSINGKAVRLLPELCARLGQIGLRATYISADQLMPAVGPRTGIAKRDSRHELEVGRGRTDLPATLLERFLVDHDLVLIQAPPLLGSALTEYAVRCADASILLVDSTVTTRTDLRRAAMLLERLNPQGVATVLEDMPLRYADPVFLAAVRTASPLPFAQGERVSEQAAPEPASLKPMAVATPASTVLRAAAEVSKATTEERAHASALPQVPFTPAPVSPEAGPGEQAYTGSEIEEASQQEHIASAADLSPEASSPAPAPDSDYSVGGASREVSDFPAYHEQETESADQVHLAEDVPVAQSEPVDVGFGDDDVVVPQLHDAATQEQAEVESTARPAAMSAAVQAFADVSATHETDELDANKTLPERLANNHEPFEQNESEEHIIMPKRESTPETLNPVQPGAPRNSANFADMASRPAKWLRRLVRLSEEPMPTIHPVEESDLPPATRTARTEAPSGATQQAGHIRPLLDSAGASTEAPIEHGRMEIVFREEMPPAYSSHASVPVEVSGGPFVADPEPAGPLATEIEAQVDPTAVPAETSSRLEEEAEPEWMEAPSFAHFHAGHDAQAETFAPWFSMPSAEPVPEIQTWDQAVAPVEAATEEPGTIAPLEDETGVESLPLQTGSESSFMVEEEPVAVSTEHSAPEDVATWHEPRFETFASAHSWAAADSTPEIRTWDHAEAQVEAAEEEPETAAPLVTEPGWEVILPETDPSPLMVEEKYVAAFREDAAPREVYVTHEPRFETLASELPLMATVAVPEAPAEPREYVAAWQVEVGESALASSDAPLTGPVQEPVQAASPEEAEGEPPVGSFSDYAEAPTTVAAAPSFAMPQGDARPHFDTPGVGPLLPPAVPDQREVRVADSGWGGSSFPPQRRLGLVRAVTQAAAEGGPPARASEGLAAMRTGSGLQKAMARQEASLRDHPLTSDAQPPMSRQWAMLSRFERAGGAALLERDNADESADAAGKNGSTGHSRDSNV